MIRISSRVTIPEREIDLQAVRSQGAGGQKVDKTATAIHLFFDIPNSSLPEFYKERLLALRDQRIGADGIIVIKAQEHRTQEQNRKAALERLRKLIANAAVTRKKRKPTRPTRASRERRLQSKTERSQKKARRKKVDF